MKRTWAYLFAILLVTSSVHAVTVPYPPTAGQPIMAASQAANFTALSDAINNADAVLASQVLELASLGLELEAFEASFTTSLALIDASFTSIVDSTGAALASHTIELASITDALAISTVGLASSGSIPRNASFTLAGLSSKPFSALTGIPTTIFGYGITDAASRAALPNNASFTPQGLTGWPSQTGKTGKYLQIASDDSAVQWSDVAAGGGPDPALRADCQASDALRIAADAIRPTFDQCNATDTLLASLTQIPNNASFTLAGLGSKPFSSLTGIPTTISGYGLTDAASTALVTTLRSDCQASDSARLTTLGLKLEAASISTFVASTTIDSALALKARILDLPNNASFSFNGLSDAPVRATNALKYLRVNASENGYEWATPAGGGGGGGDTATITTAINNLVSSDSLLLSQAVASSTFLMSAGASSTYLTQAGASLSFALLNGSATQDFQIRTASVGSMIATYAQVGTGTPDTFLFRSATNTLSVASHLVVIGTFTAQQANVGTGPWDLYLYRYAPSTLGVGSSVYAISSVQAPIGSFTSLVINGTNQSVASLGANTNTGDQAIIGSETIGGNFTATGVASLSGLVVANPAVGRVYLATSPLLLDASLYRFATGTIGIASNVYMVGTLSAKVGSFTSFRLNAVDYTNVASTGLNTFTGTQTVSGNLIATGVASFAGILMADPTAKRVYLATAPALLDDYLYRYGTGTVGIASNAYIIGTCSAAVGSFTNMVLNGTPQSVASLGLNSFVGTQTIGGGLVATGVASLSGVIVTDPANGRIGVMDASPDATITAKGTSGSPNNVAFFKTNSYTQSSAGSAVRIGLGASSGNTYGLIDVLSGGGSGASNNLVFCPYGGNVGLGTSTPAVKLHIDDQSSTGLYSLFGGGSSTKFQGVAAGTWTNGRAHIQGYYGGAASDLLLQLNGGNVGIGTSTPQTPAAIYTTGNAATSYAMTVINVGGSSSNSGGLSVQGGADSNSSYIFYCADYDGNTAFGVRGNMLFQIGSPTQTIPAANTAEGSIYYNKTTHHFMGSDGTNWKQLDN